jgi:transcriptional regulator with PAS, ATPase and Fis domain
MRACLELVEKAQRSAATVLLQGETGTGKDVLARVIHAGGSRAKGPFVAINCSAFPETLLESELFGHERGAFTGAHRSKRGHFEEAHQGTLFLDEIGETSAGFQVKLLRVLQESRVRRLGSTREHRIDARIVAASNRDLLHAVETQTFRRDLYYRLNVLPISLPPLRARVEDIVPLVRTFLERVADTDAPKALASDAARLLETYPWPGNVRELENEVARIVANANGEPEVTARMLSAQIQGMAPALPPDPGAETLRQTMGRFEAWLLRCALERHAGRRIVTARSLGITRECLYKKLRRYGMQ